MIPIVVVIVYLAVTLYIGLVAFGKGKSNTEDFFLASRTIGPMVFFMSLRTDLGSRRDLHGRSSVCG